MRFGPLDDSDSSAVMMSTVLCLRAQVAYVSRLAASHASPVATEQSCMLWHMSGMTKETVGRSRKCPRGNRSKVRFAVAGTVSKLPHGLCLRAYRPFEQPV